MITRVQLPISGRLARIQRIHGFVLVTATFTWACPSDLLGATLADLFAGGSITAANARFDDWELVAVDVTGQAVPNFAEIDVLPLVGDLSNPGVRVQGNEQLTTSGINSLDLYLRFRVSALAGTNTFTGHELNLSGIAFGDPTGRAIITQELVGLSGVLGTVVVVADNEAGISQPLSSGSFASHPSFLADINVFLSGSTGAVNLASFSHRFSQTGPHGLAGDFNGDGIVDAADYTVWRDSLGASDESALGFNGDGAGVGASDYVLWRDSFGDAVLLAGVTSGAAVPEPSAALSILVAGAWVARGWRRQS